MAIRRRLALSAAKPNRLQHASLGFVALLLNPTYILTIVFAWMLLAEPVSLAQLAGAALVVAGVLLVSRRKKLPTLPAVNEAACIQGSKQA